LLLVKVGTPQACPGEFELLFKWKKSKKPTVEDIIEKVKDLRDLINMSGRLNPSELRDTLRMIADTVSTLSEVERDRLARQIDELFDEKISIRKGWREENVRKIRGLLKEISMVPNKQDPIVKTKMLRAEKLDMQIRMDDATIEAMLQIKETIVDTIRRGMEPFEAWAAVTRITSVLTDYAEELSAMQEEYEATIGEVSTDVTSLMQTYGITTAEKVSEAGEGRLKELIEKYGSSETEHEHSAEET